MITMPHDTAAERSVLASMLEMQSAQDDAMQMLQAGDFYSSANQKIFGAMVALSARDESIDPVTVAHELRRTGAERAESELPEILDAPTSPIIASYATIVLRASKLRQVYSAGRRMAERALASESDAEDVLDSAEAAILAIRDGRDNSAPEQLGEIIRRNFDSIEMAQVSGRVAGVSTGFAKLDSMTTGMHRGELWIIAARPGMGKTSFALAMALKGAMQSEPVRTAVFSLEMSKAQLGERSLSAQAGVEMRRLRSGRLTRSEMTAIGTHGPRLIDVPLYVDDTAGLNIMQLRAKARRIKSKHGLDLLIVDYLQLMDTVERGRSREREVAEMSRGLKNLAKELEIPVVALSQLSRAVEQRLNKRPQLSDLRESGAIEQDADTVLFIYRDEVYNKGSEDAGKAELIIGKQRNGPVGVVRVAFEKRYTRFDDGVDEW